MVMTNEELIRSLSILNLGIGIEDDIASVTLRDATIAFQKLAVILHPDKAGDESTAAFQELRDAFEKIRAHFKEKIDLGDQSIIANYE